MTNYVLNEEKMFADITDGIAIIINSETGIYYGMNALGTLVYQNLTNGVSAETILSNLKKIPNAPQNLKENFTSFVNTLVGKEIIIPAQECNAELELDTQTAITDNFILEIKEYNDAQELLLADPIHEVKEETGWTPEKDSIGYSKAETIERESKVEA